MPMPNSKSQTTIETKHYSDGTSATGTPPLPDLSPGQQAIRIALTEARRFAEWPAGADEHRRVVALIDEALRYV